VRFDSSVRVSLGAFALTLAAVACTPAVIEHADGGAGGAAGGKGGGGGGAGNAGIAGTGGGAGNAGTGGGAGNGAAGGTGSGAAGAGGQGSGGHGGGATGGSGGTAGGGAGQGGAGGTAASGGSGGGGAGGQTDGGIDTAPTVTPTLAGQIVVTELMHDTDVVGDDFGEWFEIYNPAPAVIYDLYGCQIRDTANAHTITAHLLVPPHAFRTLAIFAIGGGFVPDYTYSGIKFDNDNADLVSIYCGSTLIDKFSYTKSQAQTSGHSFSVDPAHYSAVDNDNPAYYCEGSTIYNQATTGGGSVVADYGSPGVSNPPCQ
jgi:hypothetical protein